MKKINKREALHHTLVCTNLKFEKKTRFQMSIKVVKNSISCFNTQKTINIDDLNNIF